MIMKRIDCWEWTLAIRNQEISRNSGIGVDIKEGLNAGVWTVGVILGSNELGLTEDEVQKMPAEELKKRMMEVRERMYAAGAHYVVESIEELPALIDYINTRMANE